MSTLTPCACDIHNGHMVTNTNLRLLTLLTKECGTMADNKSDDEEIKKMNITVKTATGKEAIEVEESASIKEVRNVLGYTCLVS